MPRNRGPAPAATASRRALAALAGALVGAGTAAAAGPDLCEGLVTHTDAVAVPPVKRPPFMKRYRDPAFGTTVIRVTESVPDEVHKPPYSTMQAWNADETLLLLYRTGPGGSSHVLLDGHDYTPAGELDIFPSDLEEVFWSHDDPNALYYVSKDKQDLGLFQRIDPRTGDKTLVKDFSKWCGDAMPRAGNGVHMQSLDDDLFGFRCKGPDGPVALTYRVSTDEVVSTPIGEGTPWAQWNAPIPAPSGERLWFHGTALGLDLETVQHEFDMDNAYEHANVGLTHDGHDAIFAVAFDPAPDGCEGDEDDGVGHLVAYDLETGGCRNIIGEQHGYPYVTSGTHLSAQAWKRPGWVAMSSIGYPRQLDFYTNGRPADPLFSEIYLANTDPENRVVCRLAQHRSYGKLSERGDYTAYFAEPHATISPSGTRVLFGSNWYDSGSVDAYVIELPGLRASLRPRPRTERAARNRTPARP